MNKHMNQLYLATDQLLLTLFTMSSRVNLRYKTPSLVRHSLLAFWKVLYGRFYCIHKVFNKILGFLDKYTGFFRQYPRSLRQVS